jgi:hypothetical protein
MPRPALPFPAAIPGHGQARVGAVLALRSEAHGGTVGAAGAAGLVVRPRRVPCQAHLPGRRGVGGGTEQADTFDASTRQYRMSEPCGGKIGHNCPCAPKHLHMSPCAIPILMAPFPFAPAWSALPLSSPDPPLSPARGRRSHRHSHPHPARPRSPCAPHRSLAWQEPGGIDKKRWRCLNLVWHATTRCGLGRRGSAHPCLASISRHRLP